MSENFRKFELKDIQTPLSGATLKFGTEAVAVTNLQIRGINHPVVLKVERAYWHEVKGGVSSRVGYRDMPTRENRMMQRLDLANRINRVAPLTPRTEGYIRERIDSRQLGEVLDGELGFSDSGVTILHGAIVEQATGVYIYNSTNNPDPSITKSHTQQLRRDIRALENAGVYLDEVSFSEGNGMLGTTPSNNTNRILTVDPEEVAADNNENWAIFINIKDIEDAIVDL